MDGFILRYFLIKLIRIVDRAVLCTRSTTRAFVLYNVSGLSIQRYREVSRFPFYTVNFSVSQDLYIGLPADLDQFGREYSHGAVIGGKGLVKLGHMAPNARRFLNQVNLKAGSGKIKRGLNTADPSTNNHYVSKIVVSETFTNLLYYLFFFHFLSPHQVSSVPNSLPKKSSFAGCSKMPRCKAPKILRSEAYLAVRRNDEG